MSDDKPVLLDELRAVTDCLQRAGYPDLAEHAREAAQHPDVLSGELDTVGKRVAHFAVDASDLAGAIGLIAAANATWYGLPVDLAREGVRAILQSRLTRESIAQDLGETLLRWADIDPANEPDRAEVFAAAIEHSSIGETCVMVAESLEVPE
jgi:hypothetical protein